MSMEQHLFSEAKHFFPLIFSGYTVPLVTYKLENALVQLIFNKTLAQLAVIGIIALFKFQCNKRY